LKPHIRVVPEDDKMTNKLRHHDREREQSVCLSF
jgi:hypothetical protein